MGIQAYRAYCLTSGSQDGMLAISEARLHELLRIALATITFDETWYLATYADVNAALQQGEIKSGRDHFIAVGYFEGRLPRPVTVDTKWYIDVYPDVAAAIRRGDVNDAQEHFKLYGYAEGRLPFDNWSL
jgi:hypothetical protein